MLKGLKQLFTGAGERARAFRQIADDARAHNEAWATSAQRGRAILDAIAQWMGERDALEQANRELHQRANAANKAHRAGMSAREADADHDFRALHRLIDARFRVHGLTIVTENGIPRQVVGLLLRAVRERDVLHKRIRDDAADAAELRRGFVPALRVEQPGYGVYLGINALPTDVPERRDGARFSHEPPPEATP